MRSIRRNAKKIFAVLFTGAILVAAVAIAQEAVYSLNVVGFQKVAVKPSGLTLPGVPFQAASYELNSLIGPQLKAFKNATGADKIFLWDSTTQTYKKYFLNSTLTNKWAAYETPTVVTTNAFAFNGDGFWISAAATTSQTLVIVGDVLNASTVTNLIPTALSMNSYPFSCPRAINDMSLNNGKAFKNATGADKIFLWDPETQQYKKYFLNSVLTNKWASYDTPLVVATNVVEPSMGFWYTASTSFNWTAVRPYTID